MTYKNKIVYMFYVNSKKKFKRYCDSQRIAAIYMCTPLFLKKVCTGNCA